MGYTLDELEEWRDKIILLADSSGLTYFPQEFEMCDADEMLSYMTYSGMPSHYPHWSYGKSFEKLRTLYEYGISGLPYEMVINSNPCIAYLMRGNSLALQITTMAHVYGHNDFFRNNFTFQHSHPENTIWTFKTQAKRVRDYVEDPSVGLEKVERVLDAAHALSLQCRRNLAIKKLSGKEEKEWVDSRFKAPDDPFYSIHKRTVVDEAERLKALGKVPREPEEDILLFIRDHNFHLEEWEKDLLTMVHEEAQYSVPQIETKIMNEGWASFWHKRILEALNLPQGLHMEFVVRHAQVLSPTPGGLNPYHLGLSVWDDLVHRYDELAEGSVCEDHKRMYDDFGGPVDLTNAKTGKAKTGLDKIFEVREVDRDVSFLRSYLTREIMQKLNLFEYRSKDAENYQVTKVSDQENWKNVKTTLLQNIGMGTVPVIKVEDANYRNNQTLFLMHYHDGRDLQLEYAEKTLGYVKALWGKSVTLETIISDKKTLCYIDEDNKFHLRPLY